MACDSLVALSRACGSEGLVGGISQAYMIAFADCENVGSSTDIYTLTGGVVSEIGVASGKSFVKVDLLPSSSGLTEELTKNTSTGNSYLTTTFTLVLADLNAANRGFISSVLNQNVVVVTKSRTGKFYAAGLKGELELSALTGGLGIAEGDAVGHTLTFTGITSLLIPSVDPTLIPTLLIPAT